MRRRKLYITGRQLAGHVRWLQAKGYRFTTLADALAESGPVACVTFDDAFRDVVTDGLPALRALSVPATVFAVTSRVGERGVVFDGDVGVAPADLAGWDELAALREEGWEIGSHAHRHVRLTKLAAAEKADELGQSACVLKDRLGVSAASLAYPYGAYDAETIEAAKHAGFRCGATTKSGQASAETPFQLRRVILSGFGVAPGFERLKLAGVHAGVYPLSPKPL